MLSEPRRGRPVPLPPGAGVPGTSLPWDLVTDRRRPSGGPALLLDLDGTICQLFAHTDLDPLRRRVADLLRSHGLGRLAAGDVFTAAARVAAARTGHVPGGGDAHEGGAEPDSGAARGPALVPGVPGQSGQSGAIAAPPPGYGCDPLVEEIDALLTEVELRAAETAPLVAGAEEVITRWVTEGRPVAVVTNNSPACVGRLAQRCLPALAQVPVVGRDPQHPDHAKPDPWGIHRALSLLGPDLLGPGASSDPGSALMVGDSLTDLQAARAAGCGFLGMGSTPAKRARLGAAVSPGGVVTDFHELHVRLV